MTECTDSSTYCAVCRAYCGELAGKAIGDGVHRQQHVLCCVQSVLRRVGWEGVEGLEDLEQQAEDGLREILVANRTIELWN